MYNILGTVLLLDKYTRGDFLGQEARQSAGLVGCVVSLSETWFMQRPFKHRREY